MAMWIPYPHKRDAIQKGYKPTMRDHGAAGFTCIRDGWIGYGATAEAAWYDLWATYFSVRAK